MAMTTAEFKRLKDLLMRAAATDSDPELVQCFRRASLLLATHGHTWAQAMDRVVRVVDPIVSMDGDLKGSRTPGDGPAAGERRGGGARSANPPHHAMADDWDRLFDDAMAGASGSFLEMLESIHEQYEERGTLSPRQEEVVREAAERHAERHPGGRMK